MNCYDPSLKVYNRGWLTLVNEKQFDFRQKLMEQVSQLLTQNTLTFDKQVIKKRKLSIKEDESLWKCFDQKSEYTKYMKDDEERIIFALIKKVMNTRLIEEFGKYR